MVDFSLYVLWCQGVCLYIPRDQDGTVRLWHSTTYRLENTLNYGMERVWSLSCLLGSNKVAMGTF
jgi:coatomer subunit beta'